MVPGGRRHATGDVWLFGKAALRKYLSLAGRGEIALFRVQGHSIQGSLAGSAGRSTISRELRRNGATRSGGLAYRATTAQWHAE